MVINGTSSDWRKISAGVPQGSILGPLIFLTYINDLAEHVETNIRLYADDASLYITYQNADEAATLLNDDLARVQTWADKWLMTFNPSKTESLTFSRKHHIVTPPLIMNNAPINEVQQHTHLGLTLQQNGRWTEHLREMITRAKKRVDILRSLTYRLTRQSLQKLYTSFIRPILEYGSSVWDNCSQAMKLEVEKVQLSAIRAITGGKKGTSHNKLYQETGMEKLDERRQRQKLNMFYKIQHDLAPQTLKELIPQTTSQRTSYQLRSSQNLTLQKTTTKSLQDSFFPSTTKAWNNLGRNVREASTLERFKELITPILEQPPSYYSLKNHDRKAEIVHTRIRLQRSDLNEELYEVGLCDTPMCICKKGIEDAEHYFLYCPLYQQTRDFLTAALGTDVFEREIEEILYGSPWISEEENKTLFETIQCFIKLSGRFK